MKTFSQRIGIKPVRTVIQREAADELLRNALWNAIHSFYTDNIPHYRSSTDKYFSNLLVRFWVKHYGNRIDELDGNNSILIFKIKNDFLKLSWNEMFDILEFFPNNYILPDYDGGINNRHNNGFVDFVNTILEKHLSAYRFVDKLITEISSEEEISSIESALEDTSKYRQVQTHIRRALELLSDRTNPDYRNSIKESISAIESFCCTLTDNPKATLGQALKEIEKKHNLHSALKSSFSSLYGYTSDENGIRHSLLDESTLRQEDAKFMLVACSAFINYLMVKSNN